MNDIIIINGKEFKSFDGNYYVSRDADVYDIRRNKLLNKHMCSTRNKSNKKYECVSMYNKSIKLYKLVYTTWCGEVPPGYQINHIDDDGSNNRLDNLYLGTKRDNTIDAFNNGVMYERVKSVVVYDRLTKQKLTFLSSKLFCEYIGYHCREPIGRLRAKRKWIQDRFIFFDDESVETNVNYNDLINYPYLINPILFDSDINRLLINPIIYD